VRNLVEIGSNLWYNITKAFRVRKEKIMSGETIKLEFELPQELFYNIRNFSQTLIKAEALKRLAATFYADGSLSLGKASQLANVSKQDFLDFLSSHNIPINYDVHELEKDLSTIKEFIKNENCL
jgi:predicted HTH domain antitoxin